VFAFVTNTSTTEAYAIARDAKPSILSVTWDAVEGLARVTVAERDAQRVMAEFRHHGRWCDRVAAPSTRSKPRVMHAAACQIRRR